MCIRDRHNTYVKRFDEDLRYAHMATIAKMKDKRMILLYQAAPGASTVEKKDSGEEEKERVVVMKEIPRITSIN